MDIAIKRVYEPPARGDGTRVLVDRLWPRGVTKEGADVALWLKDIAPSPERRRWFSLEPGKWSDFTTRYFRELQRNKDAVSRLRALRREGKVTLVYASRDEACNNAAALKEYLERHPPD